MLRPSYAPPFTPSSVQLGARAQYFYDNRRIYFGVWVLGLAADSFLLGIVTLQVSKYISLRKSLRSNSGQRRPVLNGSNAAVNPRRLSVYFASLVSLLCFLSYLKSADLVWIMWDYTVTTYGDPDSASLLIANWWHYGEPVFTAVIGLIAQCFFIHRHQHLTKRTILSCLMVIFMLASFAGAVAGVVFLEQLKFLNTIITLTVHFVLGVTTDLCITVSMTHFFLKAGRNSLSSNTATKSLLARLISMMWQAAVPPSICITINLILLLNTQLLILDVLFNIILAKLYVIATLYTIIHSHQLVSEAYTIPTITSGATMTGYITGPTTRNASNDKTGHSRRSKSVGLTTDDFSDSIASISKDSEGQEFPLGILDKHSGYPKRTPSQLMSIHEGNGERDE